MVAFLSLSAVLVFANVYLFILYRLPPAKVDAATGNVRNWAGDISARAKDFTTRLSPGESTYVAECYLTAPESQHTGVYSRSMF